MREDWEYKKLEDISSSLLIEKAKKRFSPNDVIRYIDISSIDNINQCLTGTTSFKMLDAPSRAQQKVEYGDILISTVRPNLRNIAIVNNDASNLVASSGFCVLRINDAALRRYIFYYVLSNKFTAYLEKLTNGANYPAVKETDVRKAFIPIPPKSTQLSIVSELDKLNELIRIKKEQLKDYDTLAQSIFYEMFGDPVENEKGWEVKELIETVIPECKISYGIVQPGEHVEDGVPIVRPVDMLQTFISKDGLKKTTKEISNSYNRTILTGKELLICVRGTTGVVSLVDESLKGANVTRGIAPLLFSMDVERWFMYYQIKTPSVRGVISSLTRGIALKQINMSDLRKIQVILPPLPLQHSFAQKIEQIEQQKAAIQKTITDLETLLAARMQYWFD